MLRFRSAAIAALALSRAADAEESARAPDEEAEPAYDATHYFIDDVADPWREGDALERERLSQHAQLRDMVVRGEWAALKARLAALGSEAGLIANLTPGGANTLLYVLVQHQNEYATRIV
ncbi:hypothetical protein O3G_MSEX000722 [Manduca sexta]|nr:hypothetical protein O3G_MSEX000722 [Manduca sexta]